MDDVQYGDWEPWFAWHPVKIAATGRWTWLRRIKRRRNWGPVIWLRHQPPRWVEYRDAQ